MPPPPVKVELHYDIGSPKSWIALELLLRYVPVWNLELSLHPGLLGAVHKLTDNKPPGANPYKGAHFAVDFQRDLDVNKLQGGVPPFFGTPEHNLLPVARLLRAIKTSCTPEQLLATTLAFNTQCWTKHVAPTSPEFFSCLVPSVFSEQQLKDLVAKSVTTENKDALKQEMQSLVDEYGAFGFPWIIVHMPDGLKECFFGSDRMESMSFVLGPGYKYTGPFPEGTAGKSRL